jgi:fumarate hydratase subunit alpha
MREIKTSQIIDKVKELFLKANYHIDPDLLKLLQKTLEEETSPIGKYVLKMIIENNKIALREELPICQDTGLAVLFIELGQEVRITDGDFTEAINQGIKEAYQEGYLRKSVVDDPLFERKNTKTNTPAIIYTDIGVGIGGTADRALVITKKAITRKVGEPNKNEKYATMEKEILKRIKKLQ